MNKYVSKCRIKEQNTNMHVGVYMFICVYIYMHSEYTCTYIPCVVLQK